MKVCVTSTGDSLQSLTDMRFGRCAYFIIADIEKGDFKAIANDGALSGGGAGVASGQLMAQNDVQAVITGNVGPNAMNVLTAANIKIYRGDAVSVADNIEMFRQGALQKITQTVPSHSGMKKD